MNGYLFDENLPRRITFTPSLPVIHAHTLGASQTDTALWQYAREHRLVIVTKDADFSHRIMLATPPPWIVHLRFGNLPGAGFHALLARMWPLIEARLPAHKLIGVYADRIEAVRG